jgi:hypothetical protein
LERLRGSSGGGFERARKGAPGKLRPFHTFISNMCLKGRLIMMLNLRSRLYRIPSLPQTALGLIVSFCLIILSNDGHADSISRYSIRNWAICGAQIDNGVAVANAFAAASYHHFTLIVDCPIFIHIGMDVDRPIFVDHNTNVIFSNKGEFILDNTLIPAFAIVDSRNIQFQGWRVRYVGGLPVDMNTDFYMRDGVRIASFVQDPPAAAFQRRETEWLSVHRGVRFKTGAMAPWHGPTNTSALFFIDGDARDVTMSDMRFYVAAGAKGSQFIPIVFSMTYGIKADSTVDVYSRIIPATIAVPSNLIFQDITIDGAYMGWQGNARDLLISHVRSLRYGDLQDADGGEIGGASIVDGKLTRWFSPPHLIYLNYERSWNSLLYNEHVFVDDVIDAGIRVGMKRDDINNCCSGNALSLKIGAVDGKVSNYISFRVDGLLDVLNSTKLQFQNVEGIYNSKFLDNLYPGIRFPDTAYNEVTFQNVTLIDTAPFTTHAPIILPYAKNLSGAITIYLNAWEGADAELEQSECGPAGTNLKIIYKIRKKLFQQSDQIADGK